MTFHSYELNLKIWRSREETGQLESFLLVSLRKGQPGQIAHIQKSSIETSACQSTAFVVGRQGGFIERWDATECSISWQLHDLPSSSRFFTFLLCTVWHRNGNAASHSPSMREPWDRPREIRGIRSSWKKSMWNSHRRGMIANSTIGRIVSREFR